MDRRPGLGIADLNVESDIAWLVIAVAVHAATAIWWASKISARVKALEDAQHKNDSVPERLAVLETKINELHDMVKARTLPGARN